MIDDQNTLCEFEIDDVNLLLPQHMYTIIHVMLCLLYAP